MTHVVCIGDLMVDVVAHLPGPIEPGSDLPAPIGLHGGGAAANVAVWLVADGARATFVGRIGDDGLGLRAVDELTSAGVTPVVEIDPALPTGTCIVLVDESGERSMVPSTGANDAPGDVGLLPLDADWLYVSGYALLGAGSRPFALEALAFARGLGWSIAIDAASAAPLANVGARAFLTWIGTDVVLFANTAEAQVLSGLAEPAAAAQYLALRCGTAVVKRGAGGAVWSDGSSVRSVPAVQAPVYDCTGAGDAFAAGFLACTGDTDERLAAATALAARAVRHPGARPT
ncbi:MAG: PfkB family carbohydrate kinase [Jatrophihabitans sp.]